MASASTRHELGGGQTVKSVKLRGDWQQIIDDFEKNGAPVYNKHDWTPEEDAFLLRARAAGVTWKVISKALGLSKNPPRQRFTELTNKD